MIKPKSMQCQHLYRLNFRYDSIIVMNNDLVAQQICFLLPDGARDLALVRCFVFRTQSPLHVILNGSIVLIEPRETSCFVLWPLSPTKKISLAFLSFFFYRVLYYTPVVCRIALSLSLALFLSHV